MNANGKSIKYEEYAKNNYSYSYQKLMLTVVEKSREEIWDLFLRHLINNCSLSCKVITKCVLQMKKKKESINTKHLFPGQSDFFSNLQIPADLEKFIYSLKNVFTRELISNRQDSIQTIEKKYIFLLHICKGDLILFSRGVKCVVIFLFLISLKLLFRIIVAVLEKNLKLKLYTAVWP